MESWDSGGVLGPRWSAGTVVECWDSGGVLGEFQRLGVLGAPEQGQSNVS